MMKLVLLAFATGVSARLGSEPSALMTFLTDVVEETDVEALRERFDVDVAGADVRRRLKSCSDADILFCEDNLYTVSCGAFSEESNKVCKYDGDSVCCASSKDDCCDDNEGMIAGVAIAGIVAVLLLVLLCCSYQRPTTGVIVRAILAWKWCEDLPCRSSVGSCCKCCPFYSKLCCAKGG
jgi:hypothetical protein